MKLAVEMYGLSPYTEENKTEVEVKEGASIPELIAALGRKLPALEGNVKEAGKDRLLETYGLYINGQFIEQNDHVQLKQSDRVVVILLAVGG